MADKLEAKISLVDYDEQTETSSYKIHISCDQNEIWTVERNFQDFIKLDQELRTKYGSNLKSFPNGENVELNELEEYFNQVLTIGEKDFWQTEALFSFLDTCTEKSIIRDIQMKSMREKIIALDGKCAANESKHIIVEQQLAAMTLVVNALQEKVTTLSQMIGKSTEKVSNVTSSNVSEQGGQTNTTTESSDSSSSLRTGQDSSRSPLEIPAKAKMSSLERSNSENSMTLPKMNVNAPEWAPPDKGGGSDSSSSSSTSSANKGETGHLTQDDAVDALIQKLQPHDAQLEYRSSAIELVRKQVRLALQANAMEVGVHVLRCFLPSDPIRLCVMMNKKAVTGWQTALFERLNIASEKFSHAPSQLPSVSPLPDSALPATVGESSEDLETLSITNDGDDDAASVPITTADATAGSVSSAVEVPVHSFGNVDFAGDDQQGFRVTCTLDDGSLDMEITANCRPDLCMLAFLEDVAGLVGHNHLFKRSLLLIRAWWVYETVPYVGSPVSPFLTDFAFCVMVCAVFNQHVANLSTPFQALWCFLREYDGYDGTTQAITLQGIVPFASDSSNQPCVVAPHEGHLISAQMVDKYRQLFAIGSENSPGPGMGMGGPGAMYDGRMSGMTGTGGGGGGAYGGANLGGNNMMYGAANKMMGVAGASGAGFNNAGSRRFVQQQQQQQQQYSMMFERYGYNIVHPFSCSNMVTDSMNARRIALVTKVFRIGKANLSYAMQQHSMHSFDLVAQYFPVSAQKFNPQSAPEDQRRDVWEKVRKEALENAPHWESPRSLFNVAVDKIWKNIFYCNFIIESVLSESALLTVSVEALTEQGPLPAGEVGKLLTALSGVPNLSLKLKEKFGGLKKFLERFPDIFVFSTEHPFNPHVVLRHSMNKEQMEQMNRGVFPVELLSKQRKTVLASKVFAKSQEANGSAYGEDGAGLMSHDHLAAVAMQLDDDMVAGGAAAYMSQYPPVPTASGSHLAHMSGEGDFLQRSLQQGSSGGGGYGGIGGQNRVAQVQQPQQQQQQYRGGVGGSEGEGDEMDYFGQGRASGSFNNNVGQTVAAGINGRYGGFTGGVGGASRLPQQQGVDDLDGYGEQGGLLYSRSGGGGGVGQGISLAGLTGNAGSVMGGAQNRAVQQQGHQPYAPQQRMPAPSGPVGGFGRQQGFQEPNKFGSRTATPPQYPQQGAQQQQQQPSLFQMQQHQMQQQGYRAPSAGQGFYPAQQQRPVASSIPTFRIDEYGRKVPVNPQQQGQGQQGFYDDQGYNSDN